MLPNGPEIPAASITAPLNQPRREEESAFHLDYLDAMAIIIAEDNDSPSMAAAERFGTIDVRPRRDKYAPARTFMLHAPETHQATTLPGQVMEGGRNVHTLCEPRPQILTAIPALSVDDLVADPTLILPGAPHPDRAA